MLAVAPPPRSALVPNAIAFRDPQHGLMGTGMRAGTISLTSDGGRTWRVVLRTTRPVVFVVYLGGQEWARLDDGAMLTSTDGGRRWAPTTPVNGFSTCPLGWAPHDSTGDPDWSVCTTEGGVGAMGKAVFRLTEHGWERLAYTLYPPRGKSVGGIGLMGYPLGISVTTDGFGMIWEDRGPLYVTRDGGSHWTSPAGLVLIDVDEGRSASALRHGTGFFLVRRGNTNSEELLETTDAGRSWRVVRRWP